MKKNKDLDKLAKEWNEKLKKSGFNDIEARGITFKKHATQPYFKDELFRVRDKTGIVHHSITDPSKFEKFRIIGIYIHNYPNVDPLIRKILEHYCNGLSIKQSIIKVGIYRFANREVTVKALEVIVANFLKLNLTRMIEFTNQLTEEDYE